VRYALFLRCSTSSPTRAWSRSCAEAEEAGWDGVFVWDHVAYRPPVRAVPTRGLVLAAVAMTTERVPAGRW
jgi:alkanesulfonate monooxygenase SsuD/methylene tetrahydromethanopterin reductase-like flavin-dependent oxidoreductase (luciferase family)